MARSRFGRGKSLVGLARHKPPGGCRGRSLLALAVGLGALVLGACPVSRLMAADNPARSQGSKIPFIYQKKRSFRIPFHIDEQGRARLKEVQLWVSEDSGFHWEGKSTATPDLGKFTFRTTHDGEYWFATRTITQDGQSSPPMNQEVEPSMKVVIDTVVPSIVLEPDGRRGSSASVRWEVKDEHLDLKSLSLEYQAEGAREWRKVPLRRLALLGAETWDAGTADSLRVRASVADKAGNVAESQIILPEGTAGDSDIAAAEPPAPAVEQISQAGSPIVDGLGISADPGESPAGTGGTGPVWPPAIARQSASDRQQPSVSRSPPPSRRLGERNGWRSRHDTPRECPGRNDLPPNLTFASFLEPVPDE